MYAVIVICWLFGFVVLWKIPRPGSAQSHDACNPPYSVIIPARNEERCLAHLLDSLVEQTHPPSEILVVDDHSTDATAEVARSYPVRLIRSSPLPTGWLGKPWACWQGAKAAAEDILVFLDADTFLKPNALSKITETLRCSGGLLSIQPYHCMETSVERLAAFFNVITMAGTGAFCPAAFHIHPRGAFGPCLVSRRDDYFSAGGHRRARDQVLESIELARAFREAGQPVRLYGGRGAVFFRMYPEGLRSMIEGFSKGFAGGAAAISLPMLLMLVAWVTGGASCVRHLVQAAFGYGGGGMLFWAAMYAAFSVQIYWMLRRIGNFGPLPCLLFPAPLVFFVVVFLRSVLLRAGLARTFWKGRSVE